MINIDSLQTINPDVLEERIPSTCKNIFFWDTCGILDILNLVVYSTNDSFITTLKKILDQLDNKTAISVSSIIVITELSDNYYEPYGQADKLIDTTLKNYSKIMKYLVSLGMLDESTEISKNSVNFLPTIERMIQKLLDNTYFITDDTYLKLSRDRVIDKIPPAGKKSEFKDCVIWETCLGISKYIKNNEKVFFISSNESDFGKSGDRYPEIKSEYEANSIDFVHKIHDLFNV
jgi:hypothetical protein